MGAAFPNPYGHAAIKHVNEKTGEVTYYDAAYDKNGEKGIVINKYTEEEFKKRYGERGIEPVHVDVPNEEGSLKYIAGVVNKEWTRAQRCWKHKTANVLNYLRKGLQAKAKAQLNQISMAEGRSAADQALDHFLLSFRKCGLVDERATVLTAYLAAIS